MAALLVLPASANEGMWLPLLLNRNIEDMQAHGLQLSAEEIYSVNQGSLKDAIVSLGGFCTAEVVSDQGLLLTNHHCGYSAIQSHSTEENDYLTDGFWAYEKEQELANDGLFVRFLVRMEDVTNQVMDGLNADMTETERAQKAQELGKQIADQATEGTRYSAEVKSFYHGNEFYLFVYDTYNDIRLVGAPPSSIGKFGGDTDNWMWPRHTGDFSLFRIYADQENAPADYSAENVPFTPKHHLPVSLNGVEDGDFTMVMGYPGSTDRYLSSFGVEQAINSYNPTVVRIRDKKLAIMRKYMDADPAIRINYASKYAQTANYWKYYIGQTEQLKNNRVYDKKKAIESAFQEWLEADPARKAKYGPTLELLKEGYAETDPYVSNSVFVREAGLLGADIPLYAARMNRLLSAYLETSQQMEKALDEAESDSVKTALENSYTDKLNSIKGSIEGYVDNFKEGYHAPLDQELLAELLAMYYESVPMDQQPEYLVTIAEEYQGDFDAFAKETFEESLVINEEELAEFLEDPEAEELEEDPAIRLGMSLFATYRSGGAATKEADDKLTKGYRLLTAGLREMNPDKNYSPDANSTMRLTYGTVGSYEAKDGVIYKYYTTGEGILEKMDNSDPEFRVPEKLEELLKAEDYGRYTNEKGELPVCFIHNTDITGGNSGSPVIDANGNLIGTAFDGNWEAMSGDIFFEDELQRTISVDVRYTLFIIDKYAGATNLIEEMTLVKSTPSEMAKVEHQAEPTKEAASAQ